MVQLSIVIITYNEERNIGRALDSVQGLTDDIVVIDSFSDDATEEICKKYPTRFFTREWQGYSNTKNFGNSVAKHDWVLSIDADEALSERLFQSIKAMINERPLEHNEVFSFNRLTNYCGKWIRHCGWYPDRKIRIWNKHYGSWSGDIHETIQFSGPVKNTFLQGDLYHYSYYTIHDHIRQVNHYTNISAESLFQQGKKANFFQLHCGSMVKFIKDYLFRLGFLDGLEGYAICRISAQAVFIKYIKLNQLYRARKKEKYQKNHPLPH